MTFDKAVTKGIESFEEHFGHKTGTTVIWNKEDIKCFLLSFAFSLKEVRDKEIVEKLEEMKKTNKYAYSPEYENGAVEVLQDAINLIKK